MESPPTRQWPREPGAETGLYYSTCPAGQEPCSVAWPAAPSRRDLQAVVPRDARHRAKVIALMIEEAPQHLPGAPPLVLDLDEAGPLLSGQTAEPRDHHAPHAGQPLDWIRGAAKIREGTQRQPCQIPALCAGDVPQVLGNGALLAGAGPLQAARRHQGDKRQRVATQIAHPAQRPPGGLLGGFVHKEPRKLRNPGGGPSVAADLDAHRKGTQCRISLRTRKNIRPTFLARPRSRSASNVAMSKNPASASVDRTS